MSLKVVGVLAATFGAASMFVSMAQAAEIKVMTSQATKEAYLELVPQFEKATEHKVTTIWAGTVDLRKRMTAGETADLVIGSAALIDELIAAGKIMPGSRVDIAKSGVGVAVRAGLPKPDISSGDALKKAMLAAKSIAYSTGPSGVYIAGLFQKMGIVDEIKSKIVQVKPGQPVGEAIARGEADIGFQQVSELLPVKGIDYIGPLSADIQKITVFSGGIHSGAKEVDAAKALVKFLTAPAAVPVIKKTGMEPG